MTATKMMLLSTLTSHLKNPLFHTTAMIGPLLAGALLLAAAGTSAGVLSAEQQQVLAAGDPAEAAGPAKKCGKCHGESGVSDDDEIPHLAAQPASYLFKQLLDFAADRRDGGRMNKTARKLSEQEMANLVALFASTELPPMQDEPLPPEPKLVSSGDTARNLSPCKDCHGADGKGKADKYDAPALAGMPRPYFVAAMQSFKEGSRQNDADAVMRDAAKTLSVAEIDALAAYYLALGKRQPLPPQ